jgi:hypothetical protein
MRGLKRGEHEETINKDDRIPESRGGWQPSATTETSCSQWLTRSQRISVCRTVSRGRRCGQSVDTWPMLLIAAADQLCNSAGTISRRGFGRSGRPGVDGRGRAYWTWGAHVLISARMVVPSLDMLSDLRANQWIAHLPEDHPLAKQHTSLLQVTNSITWTSAHSRQLAVSNGLRIPLVCGYDSLYHIKDDDLKLLSVRWSFTGQRAPTRSMLHSAHSACFLGHRSEVLAATAGDSG